MGEHNGHQHASKDAEVGVPQGVGQSGTQAGSQGSTWSGSEGPGLYTSVTNDEWEAPRWEQSIPRPIVAQLPPLSTTDRHHQTRMQDKGINNVQADGVINARLRHPYRFGGARRRTGLPWFRPFCRSAPRPYPLDWTRIQTRLTRSGLQRRQRRYMRHGRRRRLWSGTS